MNKINIENKHISRLTNMENITNKKYTNLRKKSYINCHASVNNSILKADLNGNTIDSYKNRLKKFKLAAINTFIKFKHKYKLERHSYNIRQINDIVYNEKANLVANFKDYLIYDDTSEFLKRFYKVNEYNDRLPRLFDYYENYSKIFPNYIILSEAKYIYKNIQKKQRIIDNQQILEVNNDENKLKNIKDSSSNNLFDTRINDSIMNQSKSFALYPLITDNNAIIKDNIIDTNNNDEIKSNNSINKLINSIKEAETIGTIPHILNKNLKKYNKIYKESYYNSNHPAFNSINNDYNISNNILYNANFKNFKKYTNILSSQNNNYNGFHIKKESINLNNNDKNLNKEEYLSYERANTYLKSTNRAKNNSNNKFASNNSSKDENNNIASFKKFINGKFNSISQSSNFNNNYGASSSIPKNITNNVEFTANSKINKDGLISKNITDNKNYIISSINNSTNNNNLKAKTSYSTKHKDINNIGSIQNNINNNNNFIINVFPDFCSKLSHIKNSSIATCSNKNNCKDTNNNNNNISNKINNIINNELFYTNKLVCNKMNIKSSNSNTISNNLISPLSSKKPHTKKHPKYTIRGSITNKNNKKEAEYFTIEKSAKNTNTNSVKNFNSNDANNFQINDNLPTNRSNNSKIIGCIDSKFNYKNFISTVTNKKNLALSSNFNSKNNHLINNNNKINYISNFISNSKDNNQTHNLVKKLNKNNNIFLNEDVNQIYNNNKMTTICVTSTNNNLNYKQNNITKHSVNNYLCESNNNNNTNNKNKNNLQSSSIKKTIDSTTNISKYNKPIKEDNFNKKSKIVQDNSNINRYSKEAYNKVGLKISDLVSNQNYTKNTKLKNSSETNTIISSINPKNKTIESSIEKSTLVINSKNLQLNDKKHPISMNMNCIGKVDSNEKRFSSSNSNNFNNLKISVNNIKNAGLKPNTNTVFNYNKISKTNNVKKMPIEDVLKKYHHNKQSSANNFFPGSVDINIKDNNKLYIKTKIFK